MPRYKLIEYLTVIFPQDRARFKRMRFKQLYAIWINARQRKGVGIC